MVLAFQQPASVVSLKFSQRAIDIWPLCGQDTISPSNFRDRTLDKPANYDCQGDHDRGVYAGNNIVRHYSESSFK